MAVILFQYPLNPDVGVEKKKEKKGKAPVSFRTC